MTDNYNNAHNNMNKKLQEATEVSLAIYNEIEGHKMPEENRIKHKALGQVLRSLVEILEHEQSKATA